MGFHAFVRSGLIAAIIGLSAQPVLAQDRRVKIINSTGYTIVRFYGSNKGSQSWEEDILGSGVLYSGTSTVIDFDDGSGYCVFDFKAVFDDGDELVKTGVNVCELTEFTYR